ncbi:hypothetical protein FSP39_010642, partial [Pinctada imbricata]
FSENMNSSHPDKQHLQKEIPILVTESFDDNNPESGDIVEEVIKETKACDDFDINEPDIVRSTKTRTPPNMMLPVDTYSSKSLELPPPGTVIPPDSLALPKAPPRRRKKGDRNSDDLSSESSSLDYKKVPKGLSPSSPAGSLGRGPGENSLDLRSCLGGRRHINAEEAEKNAVNSDYDSPVHRITRNSSSLGREERKNTDKEETPRKSSSLPRKSSSVSRKSSERECRKSIDKDGASGDKSSNQELSAGVTLPRPRSNSGRLLTDEEILESVLVLNLDTGEKVPLSVAEDKIPQGMNPLALHIMRLTKEYHSDVGTSGSKSDRDDSQSLSGEHGVKKKGMKLKKFLGKKVKKNVDKLKNAADQVLYGDEEGVEEEVTVDGKIFKIKAHHKGSAEFNQLRMLQDMSGVHTGAIWTMKFSPCGRLLSTGGQDHMLRIWVLKSAFNYFDEMRQRYADVSVSPAPSHESLTSLISENSGGDFLEPSVEDEKDSPFMPRPFCVYRGHASDLLDVSWSKNYFILSSSMDKTVRLWHISRKECLCIFQHIDFVTAIVFHPKDDRYFLSGSLDGKLRLWNIPEKKVTMWNEASNSSSLITTANFCHNGKFAVAGTYDGKCIFYTTEQLKYYTQIHVKSTRGKNSKGSKITGIEPLPGEDKILVTSNDSRIRLYDLRDLTLTCKYKGCTNNSSQIKASFSPKSKYIICGSEDHFIYIWKTQHDYYKFSSARRDRNDYWEAIKVHNATVTAAVFAPNPALLKKSDFCEAAESSSDKHENQEQIIVSADFSGAIKVVQNRAVGTN